MSRAARSVLFAALVFAVAMSALSSGGWWWGWLVALVVLGLRRRLPLAGLRLSPTARFLVRENRRTRRDNRRMAREQRRRNRAQRRATRSRRRQAQ